MRTTRHAVAIAVAITATVAMLSIGTSAKAQLVDIDWDASGHFERAIEMAPGKFTELCGKLTKGQAIAWSFKGREPVNFNIHYHEGKNVVFPARQDRVAALEGELKVAVDQDYCWMWDNKTSEKATLTVSLRRH